MIRVAKWRLILYLQSRICVLKSIFLMGWPFSIPDYIYHPAPYRYSILNLMKPLMYRGNSLIYDIASNVQGGTVCLRSRWFSKACKKRKSRTGDIEEFWGLTNEVKKWCTCSIRNNLSLWNRFFLPYSCQKSFKTISMLSPTCVKKGPCISNMIEKKQGQKSH